MFDTMTVTKVVGSICGAWLVLLLGGWAAQGLYSVGGHGDHQAYSIEVEDPGGAEEMAEEVPFAQLYAAADAGAGERLWRQCQACHKLEDGANGTGPHLYAVVGRDKGSVDGYGYSETLLAMAGDWTPENLSGFIESPRDYAEGTKMAYSGMKDGEDRANLIAYLNTFGGNADPSSYAGAAAAEETAGAEATEETATEEVAQNTASEEVASDAAATGEATTEEMATEEAATEEVAAEEVATEGGEGSAFAQLVAAADPADGERLWRQCAACHKLEDGARGTGPHLFGVVGREKASVEGFRYSDALSGLDGTWTVDDLSAFLENPRVYAKGTKMVYAGMRDEEDRAKLIAYLSANK